MKAQNLCTKASNKTSHKKEQKEGHQRDGQIIKSELPRLQQHTTQSLSVTAHAVEQSVTL